MHVNPSLRQQSFRGRNDDGSESGASWKALAGTNWTQDVDENFRIRFLIQETAGGAENNVQLRLQYNRNSAGWNDVTATSLVARATLSTQFAEDDDTTQQLGSGTFITPNSGMDEDEGLAGEQNDIDFSGNDEVEVEYCLQIRSIDVNDEDTIQFRVVRDGGSLENHASTPSVTVNEGVAPQTVNPSAVSVAFGVAAPTVTAGPVSLSPSPVVAQAAVASPTVTPGAVAASPLACPVSNRC